MDLIKSKGITKIIKKVIKTQNCMKILPALTSIIKGHIEIINQPL